MSYWFNTHVHSNYSALDGMVPVSDILNTVVRYGQPGIGLTDHGNMGGVFQLYKGARKLGLLPFPGFEAYLVHDIDDKTAKRYHITLMAFTTEGYQDLVALNNIAHRRDHYHYKPLIDLVTLRDWAAEGRGGGVAATTGCFFGWVQQAWDESYDEEEGTKLAYRRCRQLMAVFPHLFVEVQNHGNAGEPEMIQRLVTMADALGLQVLVTQDSHYCEKVQQPLHDRMKALAYGGDPGDNSFPGDGYHLEHADALAPKFDADVWERTEQSNLWLLSNNRLKLPFLDKYQAHVPAFVNEPGAELRKRCEKAIKDKKLPAKYEARLKKELGVIAVLGMADYFFVIKDICDYMTRRRILFNARGSANGSLVCWLLGITRNDPVKWGLSDDRFLTPDRERPPDIDLDVEDRHRQQVIDYILTRHEGSRQIGTWQKMGVTTDRDTGEQKGGIFQSFMSSEYRRLGKDKARAIYGGVKGMKDLEPIIGKKAIRELYRLGDMTIYKSAGVHAAAVLLPTKKHPIDRWMPLMLIASSNTTATAAPMEDCEDGGWIKVDVLGSGALSVIANCFRKLGKEPDDWDWIPMSDPEVFKYLRKGEPQNGVFQLEGWSGAKGCRELKPKSVKDIILINALYRPAALDGGYKDQYLENRAAGTAYYPHPIVEKHLKETWGVAVYQEQVLEMFRDFGVDVTTINKLLKAIKASNGKVAAAERTFQDAQETVRKLCEKHGMTEVEFEYIWRMLEGYANYGFNRAHATAYGMVAWITAYLKVRHPLEYHSALLEEWTGTDKENAYLKTTRHNGVRVLPANVNVSGANWTMDKKARAIRRGLVSIKGVGAGCAEELHANAPYKDIADLIERTDSRKVTGGKSWTKQGTLNGALEALRTAGALRDLMEDES